MEEEALFLSCLPVIDEVSRQVCRRHRLSGAEAEDFHADVRLHFMRDRCKVLRQFEGRSTLATYVNVVIQRLFMDYRNAQWGRWRPSAQAKRLGPNAILFERLVVRDGWTPDQAAELMRLNHRIDAGEVDSLAASLPRRTPSRKFVGLEDALELEGPRVPDRIAQAEHELAGNQRRMAIARARRSLPPEDALILKMRYEDAMPVAAIARALRLDQKRLYRTIERILRRARAALDAEGIGTSALRLADTAGYPARDTISLRKVAASGLRCRAE